MDKKTTWGHETELGLQEWIQCTQKKRGEKVAIILKESETSFTEVKCVWQTDMRICKGEESNLSNLKLEISVALWKTLNAVR